MSKEEIDPNYLALRDLENKYPPVDEKIIPLIVALRSLGYRTRGSCQGGLEGDSHHPELEGDSLLHPYPWVSVSDLFTPEYAHKHKELIGKVKKFNEQSETKWELQWQGFIQPIEPASSRADLERLQTSSQELADFLLSEWSI